LILIKTWRVLSAGALPPGISLAAELPGGADVARIKALFFVAF